MPSFSSLLVSFHTFAYSSPGFASCLSYPESCLGGALCLSATTVGGATSARVRRATLEPGALAKERKTQRETRRERGREAASKQAGGQELEEGREGEREGEISSKLAASSSFLCVGDLDSPIRRHHLMRQQKAASAIRRHHPMRRHETIRRQTMWRQRSASPKAMRLQEVGFGVKSFTTIRHNPPGGPSTC